MSVMGTEVKVLSSVPTESVVVKLWQTVKYHMATLSFSPLLSRTEWSEKKMKCFLFQHSLKSVRWLSLEDGWAVEQQGIGDGPKSDRVQEAFG